MTSTVSIQLSAHLLVLRNALGTHSQRPNCVMLSFPISEVVKNLLFPWLHMHLVFRSDARNLHSPKDGVMWHAGDQYRRLGCAPTAATDTLQPHFPFSPPSVTCLSLQCPALPTALSCTPQYKWCLEGTGPAPQDQRPALTLQVSTDSKWLSQNHSYMRPSRGSQLRLCILSFLHMMV